MKRQDTTAPSSFKFYDGIALALEELNDLTETLGIHPDDIEDAKKDFVYDLYQYGCFEQEPDFEKYDVILRTPLRMTFGVLRYSIDKSRQSIATGRQGGRGRKKKDKGTSEVPETTDDYTNDERGWDTVCISRDLK